MATQNWKVIWAYGFVYWLLLQQEAGLSNGKLDGALEGKKRYLTQRTISRRPAVSLLSHLDLATLSCVWHVVGKQISVEEYDILVAPPYVERLWLYLNELSTEEEILKGWTERPQYSPAPDPTEACAKDVQQIQKDSSIITFKFRELTLMRKFFFLRKLLFPNIISKEQEEISISDAIL